MRPSRSLPARLRARVRRALAPPTIVLIYHRVLPAAGRDPNRLVTSAQNFSDHLSWLTRHTRVLSPDEFLCGLAGSRWGGLTLDGGRPRVLITFDDGYADNFRHALPLLVEHDVQAVAFVASDLVGTTQPFWWDALEQIVFDGPPSSLEWHLPDGSCVPDGADRSRVYQILHEHLKPLADGPRRAALVGLAIQSGATPQADDDARPMSWRELRAWVAAGMAVGGHTCTHAQLAALPDAELHAEVLRCKRDLQAHLGVRVDSFSYPFGTDADVDDRCEEAVRTARFCCAFANWPGNARWARSPYVLPRYLVRDCPVAEFAARFAEWAR